MNQRTGKECKMVNCVNYEVYCLWAANLGDRRLKECMNCKHAHVSQYRTDRVSPDFKR